MSKAKYKQILDERMKEAGKGGSAFPEDNVKIITIDLSNEDDRKLLEAYVNGHRAEEKNAEGNFNDYLQALHPETPRGKVVVAEIKGAENFFLGSCDLDTPVRTREDKVKLGTDNSIDINGADFTGSRFDNIRCLDLENVSFRDCVFERMTFLGCLTNVDLRGTKLKRCIFDTFGMQPVFTSQGDLIASSTFEGVTLGCQDPAMIQRKGLFEAYDPDTKAYVLQEDEKLIELRRQRDEAKKKKTDEFYKLKGRMSWAQSFVSSTPPELQQALKLIDAEYAPKIKERVLQLQKRGEFCVSFQEPVLDPTYTVKQAAKRADAIKVPLQVTRRDLEEYLAGDKALTLNGFIAQKHATELEKIQTDNPDRQIVSIATIRKDEDISGMNFNARDLRGVNFSYCAATECNFERALLDGSCLEGAVLNKANFKEALMVDCNMIGVKANEADFTKAIMIRSQLACAECHKAHFDKAVLCSSDLTMADLEGAVIAESNATKADMEKVNMRYVDARHAILREAILTEAILDHANFSDAHLEEAVLIGASARKTHFEGAFMKKVQAQRANFREAFMTKVSAPEANFTAASFAALKDAAQADFTGAIFEQAEAVGANFKEATLRRVRAVGANFSGACLEAVQAERIDLKDAIIKKVDARRANFEGAMMQKAQAFEANFEEACLEKAKLEGAVFTGADFTRASLKGSDVRGACFMYANLEKANVEDILYDARTLLIDANLKGIIGDDKTVEALNSLRKEQAAQVGTLFGASRYARCVTNTDGSNDRYKCQQLGALVLSAAVGGAGYTLAGPLAGIGAGLLTALISEGVLESVKEHSFSDIGYLNNSLGDRLAEIGAVAMAAGVEAGHGAIDGAVAGLICSSAGVVTGAAATIVGVGAGLVGLKYACEGHKTGSLRKKIIGWTLTAIGTISTLLGISSLSASASTIAYATIGGAALRGFGGMASAARRLWSYKYEDGKKLSGASPEDIYREEIESAKNLVQKLWPPTMRKILLGCVLAASAIGVTFAAINFVPFLGGIAIFKALTLASALPAAGLSGFVVGYVYDKAITDTIFKINPAAYLLNKGLETATTLKEKGSEALAHIQEKGISGLTQEAIELADTAKNTTRDMIGAAIEKGSQSLSKLREKGISGVAQDAVELADTTQQAAKEMISSATEKGKKVLTKLKEKGKAARKRTKNTIKSIIEKEKERANTSKAKSEELRQNAALTEQEEKDKRS